MGKGPWYRTNGSHAICAHRAREEAPHEKRGHQRSNVGGFLGKVGIQGSLLKCLREPPEKSKQVLDVIFLIFVGELAWK